MCRFTVYNLQTGCAFIGFHSEKKKKTWTEQFIWQNWCSIERDNRTHRKPCCSQSFSTMTDLLIWQTLPSSQASPTSVSTAEEQLTAAFARSTLFLFPVSLTCWIQRLLVQTWRRNSCCLLQHGLSQSLSNCFTYVSSSLFRASETFKWCPSPAVCVKKRVRE